MERIAEGLELIGRVSLDEEHLLSQVDFCRIYTLIAKSIGRGDSVKLKVNKRRSLLAKGAIEEYKEMAHQTVEW